MSIVKRVNRMVQRSSLLRDIEVSKKKLLKAPDDEKAKYEQRLAACRQQIRLLDDPKHREL